MVFTPFRLSLLLVAITSFLPSVTTGAPQNTFLYPNDQELPTYHCQDSIDVSWTSEYASALLTLCTKATDNSGACGWNQSVPGIGTSTVTLGYCDNPQTAHFDLHDTSGSGNLFSSLRFIIRNQDHHDIVTWGLSTTQSSTGGVAKATPVSISPTPEISSYPSTSAPSLMRSGSITSPATTMVPSNSSSTATGAEDRSHSSAVNKGMIVAFVVMSSICAITMVLSFTLYFRARAKRDRKPLQKRTKLSELSLTALANTKMQELDAREEYEIAGLPWAKKSAVRELPA